MLVALDLADLVAAVLFEPLRGFYAAEGYHQDFLIKNPTYPYIVRNDLPKIDALRRVYPENYSKAPASLSGSR